MTSESEESTLLTLGQAADYLNVSRRTMMRWRDSGTVPFIRLPNGRTRFDMRELSEWLESRARGVR